MGLVGREIDMIYPDVGRKLDTDSVDRGQAFLDFEVSNDDILLPQNPQADTNQSCFGILVEVGLELGGYDVTYSRRPFRQLTCLIQLAQLRCR